MTDVLNEREFSRKAFLKGGGALIVGFSLAGGAGNALAATPSPDGYLPDITQVDSWLKFTADNKVMLMTSEVELGQGTGTGFLKVVADELDLDMSQVIYGSSVKDTAGNHLASKTDTWLVLSTGGIGGSQSTVRTSPRIRGAAVAARQALLQLASGRLGVPASSLSVNRGVVSGGGRSVTYGELIGDKLLNVKAIPHLNPGEAPAKPLSQLKLVGKRTPRFDIPAKVTGKYTFAHHVRIPGMLHGRWVRVGQGPFGTEGFSKPLSVDRNSIKHLKNVQVIHEKDFVGVVGPNEWEVVQAAQQLKVTWKDAGILPGHANLWKHYREMDSAGKIPARITNQGGDFDAAFKAASKTVTASFNYPYQGHIAMGPACFLCDYRHAGGPDKDRVTIISNTQNVQSSHTDLQRFLGLSSPRQVRQVFYEGSSTYGNGYPYFDIAQAAAVLSRAAGKPVRLQLMRWDEQGWMKNGPAIMHDIRAGIDSKGYITAFEATAFAPVGSGSVNGATRALLGEQMSTGTTAGTNDENLAPMYRVAQTSRGNRTVRQTSETETRGYPGMASVFPAITPLEGVSGYRLIAKAVTADVGIFQTGPLRAPSGPQTAFASEQVIDMLAEAAGMDPYTFRVHNMRTDTYGEDWEGPRWIGALKAAVDAAKSGGYVPHVPASQLKSGVEVSGWGMAIGTHHEPYGATVAHVTVNRKTGKIKVNHLWGAQDSGFAVDPGLLENQMVGNLMQATSKVLHEELLFDRNRVISRDWVTYPILRFADAPKVTAIVVNRRDRPPIGAGEPPIVPTGTAIANAVYDATGVRMFHAPLIPARVRGYLQAAGKHAR